ncbi:MAG: zinc-ribbon domain-containing protein [Planctomycetota bacterium]
MLIQCPACKANADVPTSKEGAKVRCGECGRVYAALPLGGRTRVASGTNNGLYIGLGVAAAVLLLFVVLSKTGGKDDLPVVDAGEAPVAAATGPVDETGWNSEIVQLTRRLHRAAAERDEGVLLGLIAPVHVSAWRAMQAAAEPPAEAPAEAPNTDEQAGTLDLETALVSARALTTDAQAEVARAAIADLTTGDSKDLVADWEPYDGSVANLTDAYAVVHLAVTPREGGTEKRTVEWELVRDGGRWKAFRWERWYSDAEKKHLRKKRSSGYEKVTLSDGSQVFEREPEPLAHLEDTPPDLRARIDELFPQLINDEPRIYTTARRELVAIGKPAVPKLLTGLYEIPLDTEEHAIQVNAIVVTLRDITGQNFFFKPLTLVGSAMGTTEERRQSAIKQWFAWWYRKGEKFTEKETSDALDDLIELSDKDKAWLERTKNN